MTDTWLVAATSDPLFSYDRGLGCRYVCGADESGHGSWAGPLVAVAVRFDYERLDTNTIARLEHLNDCKKVTPRRRAALLPVIMEVVDMAAVVVVSAAQIDTDGGVDVSNRRALGQALEAVAVPGSVNLVDWVDLEGAGAAARRVVGGDGTSAAIAAASIVAKVTRDELMRGLDVEYPCYGFATHKGYGGGKMEHEAALKEHGLSPVHRRSNRGCKPYAPRD
jgi:ribonuclease HII